MAIEERWDEWRETAAWPYRNAHESQGRLVIDCHVHLNNYHIGDSAPVSELIQRLMGQLDKHGLEHVMVLTSYTVNPDRPSVEQVLERLPPDPRLHVVEGLNVTAPQPVDWDAVDQRLSDGRTIGLKLYPGYEHLYPSDRRFEPAIELAAKHDVPVMVHTGDTYSRTGKIKFSHPLHMDEVCVDYPDVRFILCHLGNPWLRTTAEILYKDDNAYADISGLTLEEFTSPMEAFMRDEIRNLLLYAGEPDKIMYGTDWPLVRMAPYKRFVDGLGLEKPQYEALVRGTARRVFKLDQTG